MKIPASKRHHSATTGNRLRPLMSHMLEKGLLAGTLVTGQLLLAPLAIAGPEGGTVVSGQGTLTRVNALDTQIQQQSQNLLMNFDSFDLSKDESVLITQPNAAAWFVGQVVGGSPTAIFGSITANGQVALVNPQGVIFGETASINAAGVFASAMGLANQDIFQQEGAIFESESGVGGYVINHGVINASVGGSVSLLGESVTNTGVIVATLGQVHLATGNKAVVNFGPDQLIGIEVTEEVLRNNDSLKAALTNTGTIDAAGGTVMLTSSVSKSLFDHAINNEGVIRAKDAQYKDGVIKLFGSGSSVLNTGTLDASSTGSGVSGGTIEVQSDSAVLLSESGRLVATASDGPGGNVQIAADAVTLTDSATIDVSGARGGGQVQISADNSVIAEASTRVSADGMGGGSGGEISLSADNINVAGTLTARGGIDAGTGGRIALTAAETLTLTGNLDVEAPSGETGTVELNAPSLSISDDQAVSSVNLSNVAGNIEINAASRVDVNSVVSDVLDLGNSNLTINVRGTAAADSASDAIAFVMADANDVVSTTGQVTISVTDESTNANSLIDIAGTIESKPFPKPLPNDPLAPNNTISLAANNGRIRVRATGRLLATSLDDSGANSVRLIATGFSDEQASGTVYMAGSIDVSNGVGSGGTVKVLGDRVALEAGADINASGNLGGGEVLVGGNYQGVIETPDELNAQKTFIDRDATISADALTNGDGGKVIVWADETTQFFGSITARGGALGGDGGFVEVSGKNILHFNGFVSTSAENGQGGTLLLDPLNINIVDATETGTQADVAFADGTNTTTINVGLIEDTTAGENAEIILEAANQITISDLADDQLNLAADVSIVFRTRNDVSQGGGETSTGGFTMNTGDSIIASGTGAVTIQAGYSDAATLVGTATSDITVGDIVTEGGAVTLQASQNITSGSLQTVGATESGVGATAENGGNILLMASGAITQSGGIDTAGGNAIGAAITGGDAGTITLNAGTDITLSGTVSSLGGTGTVTAGADNSLSISGNLLVGSAGLTTSGAAFNMDGAINSASGETNALTVNSALDFTATDTISMGSTDALASIDVDAITGTGTSVNSLTLSAIGDITVDSANVSDLTIQAGGVITFAAGQALTNLDLTFLAEDTTETHAITDSGNLTFDVSETATTVTVNNISVAGPALTLSVAADTSDISVKAINVDGTGTGVATLTATAGSILEDATTTDTLQAGTLNLNAASIGGSGTELLVQTNALSTNTAGSDGAQHIQSAGSLGIETLTAGTGSITLTSAGLVENTADAATDITAGQLTIVSSAAIGGVGEDDIEIDVTSLDSVSAGNDQYLTGVSGLAVEQLDAGAGIVVLDVAGAVTDADPTTTDTVDITGGNVSLLADSIGGAFNHLDVAATTLATVTTGDQFIAEIGGVSLDHLNAGTGNITLSSTGAITDDATDTAVDVTATTFTVSAATSLGDSSAAVNNIDLDVTTAIINGISGDLEIDLRGAGGAAITATTNAAGDIDIQGGAEDLTLTSVTTNDGAITVSSASGNLTATSVTSATDAEANDISLTATTGALSIGAISAGTTAGDVTLTAGGAVTETVTDGATKVTAQDLSITADAIGAVGPAAVDVAVANLTTDTSGGAVRDQYLIEADSIVLATTNAGAGDFYLGAVGAVDGSGGSEITAKNVTIEADGIGNTTALQIVGAGTGTATLSLQTADSDIDVAELTTDHFDTISLTVNDGGGATSVAVDLASTGTENVTFTDDGTTATIATAGIDTVEGDRNVSLIFTGLNVVLDDAAVDLGAGDFTVDFDGTLEGTAGGSVDLTAAGVSLTATSIGSVTPLELDASTLVTTTSGVQDITEANSISLQGLTSGGNTITVSAGTDIAVIDGGVDSGAAATSLTAVGAIDGTDGGGADVQAGDVTLVAASIGSGGELELDSTGTTSTLNLTVNDSEITLEELSASYDQIQITTTNTAAGGDVTAALDLAGTEVIGFTESGTSTSNTTVAFANGDVATSGRNLTLNFIGASSLEFADDSANLATGQFVLSAVGSDITDSAGSDTTVDITAGDLTITAAGSIGVSNSDALNLNVSDFQAGTTSTLTGDLFVTEADGTTLGVVDAGSNQVFIESLIGGLTDSGSLVTAATTSLFSAASIGASGSAINVSGVTDLSLSAGDDLVVNGNADALTDLTLSVDPSGAATYELTGFNNLAENITTDGTNLTVGALTSSSTTNLNLTAVSGDVSVSNLSTTGAGTLSVTASAGDVFLSDGAMATDSGGIAITASGVIDEIVNGTAANVTTTGSLTLNAGGDIGAGTDGNAPLDIDVTSVDASISGSGSVYLIDAATNDLSVITSVAAGDVEISSGAALTATSVSASGAISLSGTSVEVDTLLSTGNSSVSLTANTGDIDDADNDASVTTSGAVSLTAASGSIGMTNPIDMTNVTQITATASGSVQATTNATLSALNLTLDPTAATESVYAISGTSLSFSVQDSANDVVVTTVSNGGNDLDFSLTTSAGNIALNDGAISVASGSVNLIAAGTLVDADGGTATSITTTGTGTVSLSATSIGAGNAIDVSSAGRVNLASTGAAGSGGIDVSSGDTLTIGDLSTASDTATNTFTLAAIGFGNLAFSSGSSYTNLGGVTLDADSAGALDFQNAFAGGTASLASLDAGASGAATISASIETSGTLAVTGANVSLTAALTGSSIDATATTTINSSDTLTSDLIILSAGTSVTITGTLAESTTGAIDIDFGQAGAGGTVDLSAATLSVSSGSVDGGAGSDTLMGLNGGDTYNINGSDQGTLQSGSLSFGTSAGIENLTGGTSGDSFTVTAGSLSGTLDGNGGTNTLDVSAATGSQTVNVGAGTIDSITSFANITSVIGDSADTITNATSYTVNGTGDDGNADGLQFSNFGTLQGTTGTDSFAISDGVTLSANLDGLGDSDTVDFSNFSTGTTIDAARFSNIEVLIDTGNAGDVLTNVSTVVIANGDSGTADGFTFTGIENITGTSGDDSFTIGNSGSLSGVLDGGGQTATDTLTLNDQANAIVIEGDGTGRVAELQGGTAGGFVNIELVEGGAGVDTFDLDAAAAINLSGGSDADVFNIDQTLTGTLSGDAGGDDINVTAGGDVTVAISGGSDGDAIDIEDSLAGSIAGDAGSDTITISAAIAGGVDAGNNDDIVNLNTGGSVVGALSGGTGSDTLNFPDLAQTINITGANQGHLNTPAESFVDFENLNGGSNNDNFVFANAGSLTGAITGGAGSDTLTGDDDGNAFLVTGNQQGALTGKVGDWSGIENLVGGTSTDSFVLGNTNNLDPLTGALSIMGGAGNDTLTFNDSAETGATAYSVTNTTVDRTGMGQVTYGALESLVLNAGSSTNGVTIAGVSALTNLNVDAGTTTGITVDATGISISGAVTFSNAAILDVNADITADSITATTNIGTVDAAFTTLTGTTAIDLTTDTDMTLGLLAGGAVTLNWAQSNAGSTLTVAGSSATSESATGGSGNDIYNGGTNLDAVDGGAGSDTANGFNSSTDALATLTNFEVAPVSIFDCGSAGSCDVVGTQAGGGISFTGVTTLTGTNTSYNFTGAIGTITTISDAGAGSISGFDGAADAVSVAGAAAGTMNTVSFTGITSIDGRAGDDVFTLGNSNSLDDLTTAMSLVGGAGTDTLTFNDAADADANAYVIANTTVDRSAMGQMTFSTFESLALNAGNNSNSITVTSLSSVDSLAVAAGAASALTVDGTGIAVSGAVTLSNIGTVDVDANIAAANVTATTGITTFDSTGFTIDTSGTADSTGGQISITTAGGSISTGALTSAGGPASADSAGSAGGTVTLNSDSAITVAGAINVSGSAGNDVNAGDATGQAGGDGGSISIISSGAGISVSSLDVSGGNASSADATDETANGGDAGSITLGGATTVSLSGSVTASGGLGVDSGIDGAGSTFAVSDAVTLAGAVNIATTGSTDGDITFASTLGGDQLLDLTAGNATVTFGGAVGAISGLVVNSAGQIDFDSTVLIDDQGLDATASVVNFDNTLTTTNGGAVTITNSGQLTTANNFSLDGAFNQNGSGAVRLGGNITTTADAISFAGATVLAADTALDGSTITFAASLDGDGGNETLTIATGSAEFRGAVGGTNALGDIGVATALTVTASGSIDEAGNLSADSASFSGGVGGTDVGDITITNNLTVNAGGAITAANSITANTALINDTVGADSLNVTGASSLGATVSTSGTQTYGGNATIINSNRTLSGSVINFDGGVTGATFGLNIAGDLDVDTTALSGLSTLSVSGATDLGADVSSTGNQSYNGGLTLSASARTLTSTTGDVIVATNLNGGALGLTIAGNLDLDTDATNLGALQVDGTANLGGNVDSTGSAQTYSGAVTLSGANRTLTGTLVNFDSGVVGGTFGLTVAGDLDVDNAGFAGLSSLAVSGGSDLGANVSSTGDQTYTGGLTLSAGARTLTSTTGDVVVSASLNGGSQDLTVAGNLDLNANATGLGTVQVTGTADLGGNVESAGSTQTYTGAVTLSGADRTLTGTLINFDNGVVGSGLGLTVTGGLDVDTTALTGLTSLTVSGASDLGADVSSTGDQTYTGGLTLSNSARTLTSTTGNIVIGNSLTGGSQDLTIAADLDLNGDASGLGTLQVNGTADLGGNVESTGSVQTYTGGVTLSGANRTLTGTLVNFDNGVVGDGFGLAVTGNVDVDNTALSGLSTLSVSGTADLGANISSSGDQTYSGLVTLSVSDRTLTGSAINFDNGVAGGAFGLTVTGNLDADNTALTGLSSLSVSGASDLGANVSSTGDQTYTGGLTLSAGARTLTSTAGNVVVGASLVGGSQDLTVAGNLDLNTNATGLGAVQVTGTTDLGGSVESSGSVQTYNGAVTLSTNSTLTASTVTFNSTVNGAFTLDVDAGLNVNDVVGGSAALTALDVQGASNLNAGTITTSGTQTYQSAVSLVSDTTLNASAVNFEGDVNGTGASQRLTVNGDMSLSGALGGTAVGDLAVSGDLEVVSGSGSILNAGNVTANTATLEGQVNAASIAITGATTLGSNITSTGGNQSYGAITLSNNTTLSSGTGTIDATSVTDGANAFALTLGVGAQSGKVTFTDSVTVDTLGTISDNYDIEFQGAASEITTATTLQNTGTLTFGNESSDAITFINGLTATAAGGVNIAGTVAVSGTSGMTLGDADTSISVAQDGVIGGSGTGLIDLGDIVIADGRTLTLGTGVASDVNLDTVAGAPGGSSSNFVINTAGTVNAAGTINTDIGSFTIANSNSTTVAGAVNVGTLAITNTTSSVTFTSDVTANALTTGDNPFNLNFFEDLSIATAVTLGAVGDVNFGNDTSDVSAFSGGIDTTAAVGTVRIFGALRSTSTQIDLGNITLGSAATIDTTNNSGAEAGGVLNIGQITGGANSLNLDSGTAAMAVGGAVTGITTLNVLDSGGATFADSVNVTTLTLTDTEDNSTIEFQGDVVANSLNTTATAYNLSFLENVSITSALDVAAIGSLRIGDGNDDVALFSGGNVTVNTGATITGTVSTVGSNLTLNQQVTVGEGGTATLDTGGGTLTVVGSIVGAAGPGSENLIVDSGAVSLQTVTLNNLTMTGTTIDLAQGVNLTGQLTATNSGLLTANGILSASGGFSTTGDVVLASNVVTSNANVAIGGDVTIAENTDVSITTANGDVTITGSTEGNGGGVGDETLTIDAGTGRVQLGGVFGAAGNDDALGLTSLTLVNSGAVTFNQVDITGAINQTNAATGNTAFVDVVSLNSADLKGTNFTFSDFTSDANVSIDASGIVTQSVGTLLTSGGPLNVTANAVTLGNLAAQTVALTVANDANLTNNGSLTLSGSVGRNLTIDNQGTVNLSGSVGRDLNVSAIGEAITSTSLNVTGDSVFTGLDLNLTGLTAQGDILFTIDDDVLISNSVSTVIEGSATNLDVTAGTGSITDGGDLEIDGLGRFSAEGMNGSLTLNNAGNFFGSLDLASAGAVTVNESDGSQLNRVLATDFTLSSNGDVTDGANAVLSISGTADLDTSGNITLGNEVGDSISLNILELAASDVVIGEDSANGLTLAGINVGSLNLNTLGSISAQNNANIVVTNMAVLNANTGSSSINLANASNAFGSLSLTGSDITIAERDSMQLNQVTATGDFSATVTGQVTDLGTISVVGSALVNAGNQNVTLNSAANSFGELSITAGDVEIVESNSSLLNQINAEQFSITATGDIAQTADSEINISGSAILDSGANNITLLGASNNFQGLDLTGDVILVTEASAARLESVTANQLTLNAAGNITQNNDGALNVAGLITLNSGVNDITLGGDTNQFGSVNASGQTVNIEESDGTNLVGLTATSATIDSVGNIVGTGALSVTGSASFESDTGNITLDNAGNQFGRLTLIGNVVSVVEAGNVELFEVSAGTSLAATATAGDIIDSTGSDLDVTGDANLTASGNITLGDSDNDSVVFGVTNLSGQAVNLTEQGNTSVSGLTASNATLSATGSISQQTGSTVSVADSLTLNAGADVNFDRGTNTFTRLSVTTPANALVANSGATVIDTLSSAGLTLTASGDITDNGTVSTTGNTSFVTTGNLVLDGADNSFGVLSLTAGSATVNSISDLVISRLDATTATLTTSLSLRDTPNALITVDGNANLNARANITLGTAGNTVQFGAVALSGETIEIVESDAAALLDVDATELTYTAGGDLQGTGVLDITGLLDLNADEGSENINISNANNSFAQLTVDGADVVAVNSGATALVEIDAQSFNLSSGGNITDSNEDGITVIGQATLSSTGDITLGNSDSEAEGDSVLIGSLALTGNQISVTQSNDINIAAFSSQDDVFLKSFGGNITAAADASVVLENDGTSVVSLIVDRSDGLIDFTADNDMGDLTVTGLNVSVVEAGNLALDNVDAGSVNLLATGNIVDDNNSTLTVSSDAVFNAGGTVSLGNNSASFGAIDVTAASATIDEVDSTTIAGLDIEGNFNLDSVVSVTQTPGADLSVRGTVLMDVPGGLINLSGAFGALDLQATTITLSPTADTSVERLVADTLTVDATGSEFAVAELGEVQVSGQANILANQVTFNLDSINSFGGLEVTTAENGSISILGNIQSQLTQGQATSPDGRFVFSSNDITLGATGRNVAVRSVGTELGGSLTFTGVDVDGNPTLQGGTSTLTLAGSVTLDTTSNGQSAGADINLMADLTGVGEILSSGEGITSLTVAAGTGALSVGNLAADNQINTFTVTSGGDTVLNDLFVAGNTINLTVSGDVVANGVIQDSAGDVGLNTTGGDITLNQDVSSSGVLSLTADSGSLTTGNINAGSGFNVATAGDVQFGGNVSVSSGSTSVVSSAGSVTTDGSFTSAGPGAVSVRSNGALILGGAMSSGGQMTLTSKVGSLTASAPIVSTGDLNLSAATGIDVNQIDVSAGSVNLVAGQGLKFNQNVNASNSFTAFSLAGGFEQGKDTIISSGTELVISTQAGMKIASLSGGTDVTLSIRQTELATGADAPLFERVNDPITFGDNSRTPDVQSGSGAISYLAELASVGTAEANQNFVQRAGGGIFYGLVSGQFFSDDIGTSPVLAVRPASVDSALSLFSNLDTNFGALAGDIFGDDFSAISSQIFADLSGTTNASSNAGQTSAASSSRSTAASQRDDEEEVAEVDEAAFQNLKNYDENPQGIMLPEDQQFAYDDEGSMYYMVTMRTDSGQYRSVPLFKVDLTMNAAPSNFSPLLASVSSTASRWVGGD